MMKYRPIRIIEGKGKDRFHLFFSLSTLDQEILHSFVLGMWNVHGIEHGSQFTAMMCIVIGNMSHHLPQQEMEWPAIETDANHIFLKTFRHSVQRGSCASPFQVPSSFPGWNVRFGKSTERNSSFGASPCQRFNQIVSVLIICNNVSWMLERSVTLPAMDLFLV